MPRRIAPHGAPAGAGRHAGQAQRRPEDQKRRKARRQPVGDIVQARREPSEVQVARRAVADHAVQGVYRLVRRHARQAEQHAPEQGSDDAVREVLRGQFDRSPGDTVRVQARRIAADDVSHGAATLCESLLQTGCHGCDVLVQPARRDQGAHGQGEDHPAYRRSRAQFLHGESNRRAQPDQQQAGNQPAPRLIGRRHRRIQPAPLQPGDDPTHPDHRMCEVPPEPSRVTEQGIDSHGKQQRAEQRRGVHQQHGRRPRPIASGAAPRRIAIQGGTGDG